MMRRLSYLLGAFVLLTSSFAAISDIGRNSKVEAVDGSDFRAGNIMSDSVFFNGKAMSASNVQSFLNAKVPDCDTNGEEAYAGTTRAAYGTSRGYPPPYTCLKNYKQAIPGRATEESLCGAISSTGSIKKSAAEIIYRIGKACGVSQKVLIVLLEKEQSLVTDEWPWSIQYRSATGYGCPDTAPCDSEYYGFFNQVYNAARIYKYYAKYPDSFNHIAGETNFVRYNPNSSCGGSNVFIHNQTTAGLYNYTPYQPNAAALNNLYGTGNSCSAYGNRNFWRLYNDWFGSTIGGFTLFECDDQPFIHEKNKDRKRLLSSQAVAAWGLDDYAFIDGNYLCELPSYDLEALNLARSRETGKLYMIDRGNYFHVYNQDIATAWGLGSLNQEVPYFDSSTITILLEKKGRLPAVVTSSNEERYDVYVIDAGKRYTIDGTPELDKTNLKLIRGNLGYYTTTPVMSVASLTSLTNSGEIEYSFTAGSNKYLFDYGKIKKIASSSLTNWNNVSNGPTLSNSFTLLDSGSSLLGNSLRRNNTYYYFDNSEVILKVNASADTDNFSISGSPSVSQELLTEIEGLYTINPVSLIAEEENIRLVECSTQKYLVERGVRSRRKLSAEAIQHWGLSQHYFNREDKACSYPVYSLELERTLRSRNTGYVYYVDNETAYRVHSQDAADAYGIGDINSVTVPQFNPPSIHFLAVEKTLPEGL